MDAAAAAAQARAENDHTFLNYDRLLMRHVINERSDGGVVIPFLTVFKDLELYWQKVDFILNAMNRYDLVNGRFREDKKNEASAKRHKKKGDNNFARGQIVVALKHFTRCILQAESNELLGLAYANRSATLFKLRMYPECIEDIDRAIEHSYPQQHRPSLITRKNRARELAERSRLPNYHQPPPSIPTVARNPNIPRAHVSNKLEVKISHKLRRRVFATKVIEVGEVVAIEEPVAHTISGNSDLYHCHYCFKICYNPIPCKTCTQALYCKAQCRSEAWTSYHKNECPILSSLKQWVGDSKSLLLAVRMMLLRRSAEFRALCEQHVDPMQRKLSTSSQANREIFILALAGSVIFYFVKEHTTYFPENVDENSLRDFKSFLLKYMRLCYVFGAGMTEIHPIPVNAQNPLEVMDNDRQVIACGMYPFYLHFRHSCAPNVMVSFYGTTKVLRTSRTIKPGKELFITYGPHYYYSFRKDRQAELERLYRFTCQCRACVGEYPVMSFLHYTTPDEDINSMIFDIRRGMIPVALDGIPRFIAFIRAEERQENNLRLYFYTRALSLCYDLLGNRRHIQ